MTKPRYQVRPFTPGRERADVLEARTVGRDDVLQLLDRRLQAVATSANRPHTLLVGPRGAGKTHLVEVALHVAARRPEFRERVQVVRLDEDLVGIGRYRDVVHEVAARLPSSTGSPVATRTDPEAAIARALDDRALVLVVENLRLLFRGLGRAGQRDFRAWVENSRAVMLLATSPLLFSGVQDRNEPWYGNLGISHLTDLDVDDGARLLEHVARERGDDALAAFLRSDRGRARLEAINHLAGGSPRLWMILSDCISVELLDELTPAVEALLESLVPYYQQLLWDLSPGEQALVRALANGPVQAMTVGALADTLDVDQRSAATGLGRLARARWVRAEKHPGLDRRTTWYRLREPLLRHHLHYRSAVDQPLPLIVEMLRAWFDPTERRGHLLLAEPGSPSERLLAGSLNLEPHSFDSAYVEYDVDTLLAEARQWITGADAHNRTAAAGCLIEYAVLLVREGLAAARARLVTRASELPTADLSSAVDGVEVASEGMEEDRVGVVLDAVTARASGRTGTVLNLVATCWNAAPDPATRRDRLARLIRQPECMDAMDDPLTLDVHHELAFWTGVAGDPAAARDQFADLVPAHTRILGPDHLDTLTARHHLARWTGEAGDPATARDQYASLLPDQSRVLGPEHLHTLTTRYNVAFWTSQADDPVPARDRLMALLPICTRVFGAYDRRTLTARHSLASCTGEAGEPATARDQFAALIPDRIQALGPDHPRTLSTRHNLAHWTGEAGDPATARDQFAALVSDRTRVLGPDHPRTLSTRHNLAHWTGGAGDPATAHGLFEALAVDYARIFGAGSADATRSTVEALACLSQAGSPVAAAQRLFSVVEDDRATTNDPLDDRIKGAYGEVLLQVLEAAAAGTCDDVDPDLPGAAFLAGLREAAGGDPEALARLPVELVPIVTEIRERHSTAT